MKSYLSGLKVIEIAQVLAGPAVGMYFAEKGATVIKIENIQSGGDVTRSWKLPSEDSTAKSSAYFCSVNWNKEHIYLDLSAQEDRLELDLFIKEADVVITNFKYGDAEKFKLDFASLKAINSKIILGEISGYGPKSDKVAYDLILQAESGFMSMNGTSESGPVKMPVALIDLFAAHQLKEGILEALLERMIHGGSYLVHVSLYASALASLANQATNYLIAQHVPKRMGSKHPNIAPYGELFNTADSKQITFAIGSDKQFIALCTYLDVNLHLKYKSNKERVINREIIETELGKKVLQLKSESLISDLIKVKVPVAIIQNLEEVFANADAQKLLLEDDLGKRVRTSVYTITKA